MPKFYVLVRQKNNEYGYTDDCKFEFDSFAFAEAFAKSALEATPDHITATISIDIDYTITKEGTAPEDEDEG